MVTDSQAKTAAHAVLAAVLQVREARLQALLWQRAREPFAGAGRCRGIAAADETLEESVRRHLAEKVDVRDLSHLEQLETLSDPDRNPAGRELATAYLGLVPAGVDPQIPEDTRWHPLDDLPSSRTTTRRSSSARATGSARSSRTRTSASRSRRRASRSPSSATSTPPRSATTSARRTSSASSCAVSSSRTPASGGTTAAGEGGRRRSTASAIRELEITDQFAVLRPPTMAQLVGREHPDTLAARRVASGRRTSRAARVPLRPRGGRRHPGGDRADAQDAGRGPSRRRLGDPGRGRRRDGLPALRARRPRRDRADARTGERLGVDPSRAASSR